ncbi:hypothetical protein cand_036430, partial [Cryptosporidium andersoni]
MKAFLIFSVISSLLLINASSISSFSSQVGQVYRESGDRSHDDQNNKTRTMGGLPRSSNVRKPTPSLSNSSKVDLRNMNFSLPLLNSTIVLPKPISKRTTTTTTSKTISENKSKSSSLPITELIAREQSLFYPIGNGISFFPYKPGYFNIPPTTTTTVTTTTTTTDTTPTTTTESDGTSFFPYKPGYFNIPPTTTTTTTESTTTTTTTESTTTTTELP